MAEETKQEKKDAAALEAKQDKQDAKDAAKAAHRPASKAHEQALKDAETWEKANKERREEDRRAQLRRNDEAIKIEIGPTHPLHPRNATNPSNITSPVTHAPHVAPLIAQHGEGEP